MSNGNAGGRSLALVTLAGAIISSPLVLHLYTRGGSSATAPATQPIIQITLPESMVQQLTAGSLGKSLFDPKSAPDQSGPSPRAIPRVITTADLDRLSNWELDVLRNEPFARHGRRFTRSDLQAHFEQQPWYTARYAPDAFPEHLLTLEERALSEWVADYQRRVRGTR